MNSLDTAPNRLLNKILELYSYRSLEPAAYLDSGFFRRDSWHESSQSDMWLMKNDALLFEEGNCWIESISLATDITNADIKIKTYPYDGDPQLIQVNSRKSVDDVEEIKFVISNVIRKAELITSDECFRLVLIKIEGLNLNEISNNIRSGSKIINDVDSFCDEIKKGLEFQIENLNELIEEKSKQHQLLSNKNLSMKAEEEQAIVKVKSIENEILRQQDYLDLLSKRLQKGNGDLEEINKRLLENQEELYSTERNKENQKILLSELNKAVNEEKINLDLYKSKSSLYSEDFSSLKGSIIQQNIFYSILLFISGLFGWWLICNVYEGALSLSLVIDDKNLSLKSIWSLLVSRLPIIMINFFLLTALSSIILYLIKIIVKNNEETKTVKQAAYLIREVSNYQKDGLIITDKEIFEHRMNAKMKLIQKLLRPEIEKNDKNKLEENNKIDNVKELIKHLENIVKKTDIK
ncbi:hypothetical protein [Vibrio vulnificus]|uniref:hypothetical protein n=1 Tax=Vibrio vulnificus TaxID=672 RepID=UPI001EEA9999|nr:hypothetical protein [Vibrio vulnificus]MCG6294106.1 hypothetical protein [Vibrio vulnificus]